MDICFVPSLEHLACSKIATVLLSRLDADLPWDHRKEERSKNMLKLKKIISKLLPFNRLKVKLEHFVEPLLCEVDKWTDFCQQGGLDLKKNNFPGIYTFRPLWLSDGSIDREKSADILVKSSYISPLNRFVIACMFCIFHEVLYLWDILWGVEKAFLRSSDSPLFYDPYFIVRRWIEWLDSNSMNKDWESFTTWVFQTGLWKNNVYIMKRVLATSSPTVKSHYSLAAFHEKDISIDVKRFGLMLMSRDERAAIFIEYTVDVCECFLSWPLRCNFMNLMANLWPHVTPDIFCSILSMILNMIRKKEKDFVDLLVILKSFWKQSPSYFKKAAKNDSDIYVPLNFVLNYDFEQHFSKLCFENCFNLDHDCSVIDHIPQRLIRFRGIFRNS